MTVLLTTSEPVTLIDEMFAGASDFNGTKLMFASCAARRRSGEPDV